MRVLDAGVGTGLQGASLSAAGFGDLVGLDNSAPRLDEARATGLYADLRVADLNAPFPLGNATFDACVCVGVLTYLDHSRSPNALEEMCRVTRRGGIVAFTSRTDRMHLWEATKDALTKRGEWTPLLISQPLPYLPDNPEFGDRIGYIVHMYRITHTKLSLPPGYTRECLIPG